MKKFTLLFAALFVVGVAQSSELSKNADQNWLSANFNNSEPIAFMERGVAFYVFMDGQFDFNTEQSTGGVVYRQGRRSVNGRFAAEFTNFGGTRIEHDNMGRIRRIGNVFINYDFQNRIKRIGSVYMSYNRFALTQVGGLRLFYNRFGDVVDVIGSVNGSWNSQYGPNCNTDFGNNGFGNNNFGSNGGSYYGNSNGYYQSSNNGNNGNSDADDDNYFYKKNNGSTDRKVEDKPVTAQSNGGRR